MLTASYGGLRRMEENIMKQNSFLRRALGLTAGAVLMAGLMMAAPRNALTISASAATAGYYYEVDATSLNVRTGPGTGYTRKGTLADGSIVKVLETNGNWARIDSGWVHAGYLVPTSNVVVPDSQYVGYVNASSLNVRTGPGTNYSLAGQVTEGYKLNILEVQNGWGRIDDGWVLLKYVNKSSSPSVPSVPNNSNIYVNSKVQVTAYDLNVRSGPGVNYAKSGLLSNGTVVTILEIRGNWGRFNNGWISLSYVAPIDGNGAVVAPAKNGSGIVTADVLRIRTGPGTNYSVSGQLTEGYQVKILDIQNGWARISDGWVSLQYLRQVR